MQNKLLFIVLLLINFFGFAQTNKDQDEIKEVLFSQQKLWNEGKIEAFMEFYEKSEDLKFIGKTNITQGWKATLERYLTSYPNREAMGQLAFQIVEIDVTEGKTAWLLGKWDLKRPKMGNLGGHFTLLLKKVKGKWLIFRDHTS